MMQATTTISVDTNFDVICRGCLCDCSKDVSFNIHNFQISETKLVREILSKCTSIEVRSYCCVHVNIPLTGRFGGPGVSHLFSSFYCVLVASEKLAVQKYKLLHADGI